MLVRFAVFETETAGAGPSRVSSPAPALVEAATLHEDILTDMLDMDDEITPYEEDEIDPYEDDDDELVDVDPHLSPVTPTPSSPSVLAPLPSNANEHNYGHVTRSSSSASASSKRRAEDGDMDGEDFRGKFHLGGCCARVHDANNPKLVSFSIGEAKRVKVE